MCDTNNKLLQAHFNHNAFKGIEGPGADPENIEPGGANSIKYQTEPGAADYVLSTRYKGEQGAPL